MQTQTGPRKVSAEYLLAISDKLSLLGGFSQAQIGEMAKHFSLHRYQQGDVIFEQGDQPSDIYIVLSGSVELSVGGTGKARSHGRKQARKEVCEYLPGACFGESALIGIQPQAGAAKVLGDAQLLVLTSEGLLAIYEADLELFGMLMMNLAREVSRRFHGVLNKCA